MPQRISERRVLALIVTGVMGFCLTAPRVQAQSCASLTTIATPSTQDFNTLASSGTSSSISFGWALFETLANSNTTYTAGTGSSTTGDTYSFGSIGPASNDRAFGGLQTAQLNPRVGGCFTNNTGSVITGLAISYRGEEWRLGATGRQDRLDFQYSLDATGLNNGTWTDVDALDFLTPNSTGTTGAQDGNAAANRVLVSNTIGNLLIANNATFWIRWMDLDISGPEDGLGVDDFSITPETTPLATESAAWERVKVLYR